VGALRGGDDALRLGEERGDVEHLRLTHRDRVHEAQIADMAEQRGHGVVTQAAGVDARRHVVVAEGVHLEQRRGRGLVAEVVGERALGDRGAGGRLDGYEARLRPSGQVLAQEREGEPAEARTAPDATDDDVRVRIGVLALEDRLLPDHRLVQQHVVGHAAQRILRARVRHGVLDRLADRDAQAAE